MTQFFTGNLLSPHRLQEGIFYMDPHRLQQGIFYMHFPTDKATDTTAFDGRVVDHWLERKIAQNANAFDVQNRSDDPNLCRWELYPGSPTP